mgnify:FL=1
MKSECILSAGIDIGTTTTHLILSRIGISVTGGFGTVPAAQITSKEIVYKSPVYFTPLFSNGEINGAAVAKIIEREYKAAGICAADLKSGAVIITGESACKGNSAEVLQDIAALSGDFVAAQAGSELESYLSGKGAEADKISEQTGKTVANIDVGGGTTNISVFRNGECVDTCCLHIGGRLVQTAGGGLLLVDRIKRFADENEIRISDPKKDKGNMVRLCDLFSELIFSALGFADTEIPAYLIADHRLSEKNRADILTFSGGVAACMHAEHADFAFGDIGVLLGRSLSQKIKQYECRVAERTDPIRATVIGAGQFSMEVSGSTIWYSDICFPLKNLPCVCAPNRLDSSSCALYLCGKKSPSFCEVDQMAQQIAAAAKHMVKKEIPLVVITKEDCSKALGTCLKSKLPDKYPILCIDGVTCRAGDYIDIGSPVAGGKAVPVVVKTLVFGG